MRLRPDTIIAPGKLSSYLLKHREEDDKSRFLALAGYEISAPERLERDIRQQLLVLDAELIGPFEYGIKYLIHGTLTGPNGAALARDFHLGHSFSHRRNKVRHPLPSPAVKYPLYSRIVLARDLPAKGLCRGDIATVVEYYEGIDGQEPGYEIEVFNAVGGTVAVVTVRESHIEALRQDERLCVRPDMLVPTGE